MGLASSKPKSIRRPALCFPAKDCEFSSDQGTKSRRQVESWRSSLALIEDASTLNQCALIARRNQRSNSGCVVVVSWRSVLAVMRAIASRKVDWFHQDKNASKVVLPGPWPELIAR